MTVCVGVAVNDCLVFAADSAASLIFSDPATGASQIGNVYRAEARYSEARIHRSGNKLFGTFRVTGIDHAGKPFDRYGIDLYEVRDGKIALKDSYLKAD